MRSRRNHSSLLSIIYKGDPTINGTCRVERDAHIATNAAFSLEWTKKHPSFAFWERARLSCRHSRLARMFPPLFAPQRSSILLRISFYPIPSNLAIAAFLLLRAPSIAPLAAHEALPVVKKQQQHIQLAIRLNLPLQSSTRSKCNKKNLPCSFCQQDQGMLSLICVS